MEFHEVTTVLKDADLYHYPPRHFSDAVHVERLQRSEPSRCWDNSLTLPVICQTEMRTEVELTEGKTH